ncbi:MULTISPECIES: type II toxin-antitoxin system CcdA family antitoxin [unclassified Brevundimonas]|uniref:type II toxin-antitoxin system CcdA family antitoxin n=1 Tax=unclassified Brevundimonas TaxID=2622653 RepID=UPI0007005E83|nr:MULTISPECIES: type II toxin-antitoxin system CcdA family antitoxin [unclassified Brevundimonas]KQY93114.1 post-segregation antitoxin CcdA [Brevundimonas sp. Root1423]KRA27116.1 post-segregation antitoxin CcdA [Brevundimonas sp. Root608]
MGKVELNIGIEPELVEQAQRLGLSITGMSEVQLRLHLQKIDPAGAEARAKRWAEENAEAIKDHNRRIRERGLLSDHFRTW